MTRWILILWLVSMAPIRARAQDTTRPGELRIELVELQQRRQLALALDKVREHLAADEAEAEALGLPYLEGHLLDRLDRPEEASAAFAKALTGPGVLRPYARVRLASIHGRLGHPEVAAGLLASVLSSRETPRALLPPAARLLRGFIEHGGDCRLIGDIGKRPLPNSAQREILLSRARCSLAEQRPEEARSLLLSILRGSRSDDVALSAATLMSTPEHDADDLPGLSRWIGLTFHDHREFELASRYLSKAIEESTALRPDALFETRYSYARSRFWLGDYETAAELFGELADDAGRASQRAQSRFQEARCYELSEQWNKAAATYARARDEESHGSWSGAALKSALRIHRLGGDEIKMQELLVLLGQRKSWRKHRARAALFLAISDIVEGRSDRAYAWIELASRNQKIPEVELAYWRGRLAMLRGEDERAVHELTLSLADAPYHPMAQSARLAMASEKLSATTLRAGEKLSWSSDSDDLQKAVLVLGKDHRRGRAASGILHERWMKDPRMTEILSFRPTPPAEWPIFEQPLARADEWMLALGVVRDGAGAVPRHFPVSQPELGLTGSRLLSQAGEIRASLYQAEILHKRYPRALATSFLPDDIQRLEYPLAFAYILLREARTHEVSPHLLAGILREESRFDPDAISAAAARGLAQFVLPTAREVGRSIGMTSLSPNDLHEPEVSLALAAAYVAQLQRRFNGRQEMVVAAYNAGEHQAELWRDYCLSDDPAEFFSKVGFAETRGYLRKVLSSRAHYEELYPEAASGP